MKRCCGVRIIARTDPLLYEASRGRSPPLSRDLRNSVKMAVATQYRQPMLHGKRRDPGIVGRNGRALLFERNPQRRVRNRCLLGYREDVKMLQFGPQPPLVGTAVPRLRNPITEFPERDDRDAGTRLAAQHVAHRGIAVDERRQGIGIENHIRSSASMTSNASSIIPWMRAVSLRRRWSFPNPPIHAGSPGCPRSDSAASLACSAPVTNSLSVCPRSAARDLALRKRGSGISIVVFIATHITIFTGKVA